VDLYFCTCEVGEVTLSGETDFLAVTELAGSEVSAEQVERICRRYYWAADYCTGKDVLEAACGTGQGLGYIASVAKSVVGGDYSQPILDIARSHYANRIELKRFDAQQIPFPDRSLDVVILFEALYYLPEAERFFRECRRVMRPGGTLLIATANKDLYDFIPSPHSFRYYGVRELAESLGALKLETRFFGDTPVGGVSARQRVLRPMKAMASKLGLIPKSMAAKKLLKQLVFGQLVQMPAEITGMTAPRVPPTPLPADRPDAAHKVIFVAATLPMAQK
jgi:SAM-dependent methyltransferase